MGLSGTWIRDGIGPTLTWCVAHTALNVTEAMYEGAAEIESYAQWNAPWEDQTGAARYGLTADVEVDLGDPCITLSHSVDYGIWLELIQNGAYAIIMPTLETLGPEIIRRAGGKVVNF